MPAKPRHALYCAGSDRLV